MTSLINSRHSAVVIAKWDGLTAIKSRPFHKHLRYPFFFRAPVSHSIETYPAISFVGTVASRPQHGDDEYVSILFLYLPPFWSSRYTSRVRACMSRSVPVSTRIGPRSHLTDDAKSRLGYAHHPHPRRHLASPRGHLANGAK